MPTQKQIDANRRNAQLSTGPRTPEGRDAVRANGVTHGLTAETLVLRGEIQSDFDALLADLEAEYRPATTTERLLVRQIAVSAWRLRRVARLESDIFTLNLRDMPAYDRKLTDGERLAKIAVRDGYALDRLSRYEGRLERSFYKALRELERIRAERKTESANQTQFEPQDPAPLEVTPDDTWGGNVFPQPDSQSGSPTRPELSLVKPPLTKVG